MSGMVLPIVVGLTKALAKVQTPYCTSVTTGLINAISHRLAYVQSDDHSPLCIGFRSWTTVQAEVDKQSSRRDGSKVPSHWAHGPAGWTNSSSWQPTKQGITDCMFAQDELFGFMTSDDTSTQESSTVVELNSYFANASNTDVWTFWAQHKEQYPRLYKLHLKHHSVPATSAAMERCFSAAGYMLVGPARQMTCLKLCWLLSVTKTFCDFLVSSDYIDIGSKGTSFHSDSWTGLTITVITYYFWQRLFAERLLAFHSTLF